MSRRRNRNTNKANKSNLVGLIATIIKEGDKKMNKFYLPISDLRIFSRERSQKIILEHVIDGFMGIVNKAINGDEDWRKYARGNANKEQIFLDPKDYQEDDSEKNYSNHILEGGDLLIKCSKFCRDYKVSPTFFISELSKHLYYMHERYAPKDKK